MNYCPTCGSPAIAKEIDAKPRHACSDTSCSFVHWNNPIPVVGMVVETPDGILLAQNKNMPEGFFSIITGFLEAGEDPKMAARRETKEELGLYVHSLGLIGLYPIAKTNQLLIVYHVLASGNIRLNEELEAFVVVKEQELNGWSATKKFNIEKWLQEFKVLA